MRRSKYSKMLTVESHSTSFHICKFENFPNKMLKNEITACLQIEAESVFWPIDLVL